MRYLHHGNLVVAEAHQKHGELLRHCHAAVAHISVLLKHGQLGELVDYCVEEHAANADLQLPLGLGLQLQQVPLVRAHAVHAEHAVERSSGDEHHDGVLKHGHQAHQDQEHLAAVHATEAALAGGTVLGAQARRA